MSDELATLKQQISELSPEDRKSSFGIDLLCKLAWEEGIKNPDQLKALGEETLIFSQKLSYPLGEAKSLRNLAYWNFVFGNNTRQSASLAQDGLALAENGNDPETTAEIYDILAMCFKQLGSFERSLEFTRKSMELFKQTQNRRGLGWSHRNLGTLYEDAGDHEKAKHHYTEALSTFQDLKHYNGMARIYNNLGMFYTNLQKYDLALETQLKSLGADVQSGILGIGYAGTHYYIGMVHNRLNHFELALESLEKSLNLIKERFPEQPEKNRYYTGILFEMGKVYQKQCKMNPAINYFKQSIQAAQISEDKKQEYEAYKALSECYGTLKEYHVALEHYKRYTLLQEEVLTGETNLKLDNIQMSQEIILADIEKNAQRRLKEETEKILLRVLPYKVMEELRDTGKVCPQSFENTTVLFSDFVGFTQISKTMSAEQLVEELDFCFSGFDKIIQNYGLERMKTIGDGYMAVAGVPMPIKDHAVRSVLAGLEITQFIKQLKAEKTARGQAFWDLRIGFNSGPLIAGIIGHSKFAYDVWGETVNIASRMESSGQVGCVNISHSTFQLIQPFFECVHRGEVEVKHQQKFDMHLVQKIKPEFDNEVWKNQFRCLG